MPNSLLELQNQLQAAVLNPSEGQIAIAQLTSTPAADANKRLTIYQEAYRLRLLETLENDFPALKKYWGDPQFKQNLRAYIEHHRSANPSLRWYGEKLGNFLITSDGKSTFAAELANFEWAIGRAFDAADDAILTAHALASIPAESWQNLRLELHSSLRWLRCEYNTAEIWQSLVNDEDIPTPECTTTETWIAIWRNQYKVRYRTISALEVEALSSFNKSETFGMLLAKLSSSSLGDEAPQYLVTWLREWLSNEWISAMHIHE